MSNKLALLLTVAVSLAIPAIAGASHESHVSKTTASNTAPGKTHNGNKAGGKNFGKGTLATTGPVIGQSGYTKKPSSGSAGGRVPKGFNQTTVSK